MSTDKCLKKTLSLVCTNALFVHTLINANASISTYRFNECTYNIISQNNYDNFTAIFILNISYFFDSAMIILSESNVIYFHFV